MFINEINSAIIALKNNGIIFFPTDIEWCLGCDATNHQAVEKLLKLTNRDNVLKVVIIDDDNKLQSYITDVPEIAYDLIEYSEKPLVVIYDKGKNVAENTLEIDGSIAVKVIRNEFCIGLLQKFRKPILTISENFSNTKNLKSDLVSIEDIKSKIDYIVNYDFDIPHIPQTQTIMKMSSNGKFKFIQK